MKQLYLIVDGLSESRGRPTSMERAATPNIDDLFSKSQDFGFYLPEKAFFNTEPKTDVIVPAFFNLKKEINPGRAALEIIDTGHQLDCDSLCLALSTTSDLDLLDPIFLNDLKIGLGKKSIITSSNATNTGEKILFGNLQINQIDTLYKIVASKFKNRTNDINVNDFGFINKEFIGLRHSIKTGIFLGWAKGALRGAFKHLGFNCNPFERAKDDYFNWMKYERDFQTWIIPQILKSDENDILVFYTKESAFACRQNRPDKKIQAIEMMDSFLGKILNELNQDICVAILADHSSNFSASDNPVEKTVFLISQFKARDSDLSVGHFSEYNVLLNPDKITSQAKLIELLSSYKQKYV